MRRALLLLFFTLAATIALALPPGDPSLRSFDPVRLASLETEMWKAYYGKEKVRLYVLLVRTLREQYAYSWSGAARNGFHLARAAADFSQRRDGYEAVLPDLVAAYTQTRDWTGATFDPDAVARAELRWWVDRRTPGRNAPEQIGNRLAEEYALIYEVPVEAVADAGQKRAEAAHLRDEGGDWGAIERLLDESWSALAKAVGGPG